MDELEATKGSSEDLSKTTFLRGVLICVGLLWVAYFVLSAFDDTTELLPDHPRGDNACLLLGAAGSVAALAMVLAHWKKLALAQRIVSPLAVILGFLTLFSVSWEAANLIEGRLDFPPTVTKTFDGSLLISRAYQTHGKSRSWNIQTMPIWSNMDITQSDYNFMLEHRPADQNAANKDEITSKGYFCAHVTMQRTETALRVLHAGQQMLPEHSVVICHQDR